jgi:hypothetical protein
MASQGIGVLDILGKGIQAVFSEMHTATIIPMYVLMRDSIPGTPLDSAKFLGKLGTASFAASVVKQMGNAIYIPLEALLAEVMFTAGKFWYYKFYINPSNLSVNHQKLISEEEVSDLTIINTYRNKAINLGFKGVSGCTLPRGWMTLLNSETVMPSDPNSYLVRYPKLSEAWMKFRQLERFFREINTDVCLLFDMDVFIGKFISFNYTQDANNPYIINYDLQMRVYPNLMLHLMTPSDYDVFFDTLYDRYGRTFVKTFEGKSR